MAASDDLPPAPAHPAAGTDRTPAAPARLRALRAERLARLHPYGGAASGHDDGTALDAFLAELNQATATPQDPAPLAPEPLPPAASVLPFHRPGTGDPVLSDIEHLPGVGPGLAWALRRAGLARRADLSGLEPGDLVALLGPLGRLVPAAAWIAAGRAAALPER